MGKHILILYYEVMEMNNYGTGELVLILKHFFVCLAALGLGCGTWGLLQCCRVSLVVGHRLGCSMAHRGLIPQPGVKSTSPKHRDNIRWILNCWTSRDISELILD